MYTLIYEYVLTYIYIHIFLTESCMKGRPMLYRYTHLNTHLRTDMHMYTLICIYTLIHIYICIHTYMYIYSSQSFV